MSACPTCQGTGRVADEAEVDFLPGLAEALHQVRYGAGVDAREDCAMCVVLQYAAPGEARESLAAAAAGRISGRALHRSLRQLGIRIGAESIRRHRNEAHTP